ncbi:Na+/H+ antiporter NhaC family protein [Olsenella sp. kh2p3]|uniref:Na+/H+ antiporter NhaC family protein n=1 Tax=Olsenella sp. kh2p3 TaxID=1797112 RepID=UPI00091C70FB|nr:Na+/H+ antiporter NhaC family protein [Olsenella sp. kh2p3]SFX31381.1 Na+:H+ antiporter, NhaC family [Olsenella sp. kh2p3]
MAETVTLGVFAAMLVAGTAMGVPLAAVLAGGLVLFLVYGVRRGDSLSELARAGAASMRSVSSMLVLFMIAGALAAAWRASGTIAAIVSWSSVLIQPSAAVLAAFLLCCLMSLLMGTAFGTAATMGVICMAVSHAMGANALVTGGAVLAGCYFGDRCSPVSSSAVLVSQLTGTKLYDNVRRMLRTGLVPFLVACAAYLAMGMQTKGGSSAAGVAAALAEKFSLSWLVILPAALVVALSLARVNVLVAMAVSLGVACVVCVGVQGVSPADLPQLLVFGYHAADPAVAPLIDGGGVVSMSNVTLVVGVSSTYAGIFKRTGLLDGAVGLVTGFSRRSTPFIGVLATSVVSCMVACNQTLAIMLTDQLCRRTEGTGSALALDLENSVVIVSPLVPWSISNVAVLSSVGAPALSIVAATFCYLLPLWTLAISVWQRRRPEFPDSKPAQLLGLTPADDVRRMPAAA